MYKSDWYNEKSSKRKANMLGTKIQVRKKRSRILKMKVIPKKRARSTCALRRPYHLWCAKI